MITATAARAPSASHSRRAAPARAPDDERRRDRRSFPAWHFALVNDHARKAAIERPIAALGLAGRTVIEIGSGTGLIALLFARHGAARVISCEANPTLARVARQIVDGRRSTSTGPGPRAASTWRPSTPSPRGATATAGWAARLPVVVRRSGTVHGLLSWFAADIGAASLTDAPARGGHWHQAFHPLPAPLDVRAGHVVPIAIDDDGDASASPAGARVAIA